MKKTILTLACAVMALAASAQRASSTSTSFFSTEKADQPITIGIRGGLNFSNFSAEAYGISESADSRTSFHIGAVVDFPLMESFYIQSGLFVSSKGCSTKEGEDYGEIKVNPLYLEMPILASYRYNFSDNLQLQVNFGPYIAYGIGGSWTETIRGIEYEYDFFDDDLKRFDMGLHVGGGLTFARHIYLGVGYEFGLTDMYDDEEISIKNSNFMISVGYNF